MQITVKFYGTLKKYLPQKKEQATLEVETGATIRALLARLDVPDSDVWMCAINTTVVDESSPLRDGDVLEVFEPVGGGEPMLLARQKLGEGVVHDLPMRIYFKCNQSESCSRQD